MVLRLMGVLLVTAACAGAQQQSPAQQPIGTVSTADATVVGPLAVNNGQAVIDGNATVTAKDKTAAVKLIRGGEVRVCTASSIHMTEGRSASGPPPLLLTIDRGAVEIQMPVTESDAIMTPDLRFAMKARGPLDLRLRVTSNGDTCVENHGADSPALRVTDPFGGAMYILLGGQHVLFEHASLKEVVDNESAPCGCPAPPPPEVAGATGSAAAQHPFPEAISDGLAQPTVPQATPGVTHVQVATSMTYDGTKPQAANPATTADPPSPNAAHQQGSVQQAASSQPQAKKAKGFGHSIGHFFKRIFGKL